MKILLEKINEKLKPNSIDKYILSSILESLYIKIYECYNHDLKNFITKEKREQRLCQIIHTHCYNQTWATKTAVKNTLKQILNEKQYKAFGMKLVYGILDVFKEITDDPYSPDCYTRLLSEELIFMNVDPRLEAIALKVIKKMDLNTNNKHGSIILIVMIIGIVLSLIRIIQECNKSRISSLDTRAKAKYMKDQVKNICISRTLLNRWRLKRIIKEKLNSEDYKTYGEKLKNAILDSGPELTEEESFTLVEAANV